MTGRYNRLYRLRLSTNRELELKYFCLQYVEKRNELKEITELKSCSYDEKNSGNKISKPTEDIALLRCRLEEEIKLIEETAKEVDKSENKILYPYLLKNVTEKIKYEHLGVTCCGRRQFYELRKSFFIKLDSNKKG